MMKKREKKLLSEVVFGKGSHTCCTVCVTVKVLYHSLQLLEFFVCWFTMWSCYSTLLLISVVFPLRLHVEVSVFKNRAACSRVCNHVHFISFISCVCSDIRVWLYYVQVWATGIAPPHSVAHQSFLPQRCSQTTTTLAVWTGGGWGFSSMRCWWGRSV